MTLSVTNHSPSPSASSPSQSDVTISLGAARTEFELATSKARSESRDNSESESEDEGSTIEGNDGYISDADSDYLEFKSGLEKLKESIRNLKEQGDSNFNSQRRKRVRPSRGGRGRWQGPRKAAEPTGEISRRLGAAYNFFITQQYTEAKTILSEIIQINAETYEAYTLLATIAQEEGRVDDAMTSLMLAAHMRPREEASWWMCVEFALNETGGDRVHYLETARWCLSQILRNDYQNIRAHEWKAIVYRDQEKFDRVVAEYQTLLRLKPHCVKYLRELASSCIDANKVDIAKRAYLETIDHFKIFSENTEFSFDWTDLDYYTELYTYADEYEQALREAKSLARWLRGRTEEDFWDDITTNDCEWDEDDSRRILITYFESNKFSAESYSLPLAIRIKFGILRLQAGFADEATRHFATLEPAIASGDKELLQHSRLLRQAADHLHAEGYCRRALTFYEALGKIPEEKTDSLMIQMGRCFLAQDLVQEAEKSFLTAIKLNEEDHEARTALAELWDNNNEKEKAFAMTTEAYKYKRLQLPVSIAPPKAKGRPRKETTDIFVKAKEKKLQPIISRPPETRPRPDIGDPQEGQRTKHLRAQYYILKDSNKAMRQGDPEATKAWMDAAQYLLDDFRTSKSIFAWDNKLVVFHGYTPAEGLHALVPLDPDLTEISERLSRNLDAHNPVEEPRNGVDTAGIPTSYRGIHFHSWLEIFLEHAICLAKDGQAKASYDVCEAASEANVFFHSREYMFQIYMCWSMCALISNNEAEIVKVARDIMKQHQFTTDSYRIFDVMIRMCHTPVSWYGAGPTQKFILRQIRAMDHALADEASKNGKQFIGKGSYSAVDENGQVVAIEDLNMSLLMIYGWILFTGSSFSLALNYFLRAYALDPNNPLLIFSLGLTYVHDALKRQAENRQYSIIQGLAFLHEYHEIRKQSKHAEERVEADFNLGRVYHMLGLVHLARPFYWKVLRASQHDVKENLVFEAAYNLTNIYASSGNLELAQSITNEWLVL
ncbi:RNA polymerase III transcription factor-like protein TFIIIC subunit Tfc4 [Tricladium varicosporioides]|nr:RNA polymerase III transcription factor-like protein TFIIIC subunit Tfc4 [Hymenoscyphus varicosporioides]